ncbi:hypothetical protein TELCIR_22552 [Teladorsagia circumcincta]|uniref:PiggyBac transposable element-derived protein domain-containing protein n=1 Tax=Teladorsagia circumcincta TaxID=45464 RepID=A0A2G9TDL9_TELCI|nr:hypothetical protein TELCIR_22552 [Teladorsagia circumcincta]
MLRNRFEELLTSIHFADNDTADKNNRLYKILPILDLLNEMFQKMFNPDKVLCIVPSRGRVVFRQFNKSKKIEYGVKLFKRCSGNGYTQKLKVCAGKDVTRNTEVAEPVVMELWIKVEIYAQTTVSMQVNKMNRMAVEYNKCREELGDFTAVIDKALGLEAWQLNREGLSL